MRAQWDQFGVGFESFSLWISDKEKQLEVLTSSPLPLEQQIVTVKVLYCYEYYKTTTLLSFKASASSTGHLPSLFYSACPGCWCRAPAASQGSCSAGGRFTGSGPVRVFGGGGSHQGPADPNRPVLGGAEGERAAARCTAGGKLLSTAEVQNEPGGGK